MKITYYKQSELRVEIGADKMLHMERCFLWVRNMNSSKIKFLEGLECAAEGGQNGKVDRQDIKRRCLRKSE